MMEAKKGGGVAYAKLLAPPRNSDADDTPATKWFIVVIKLPKMRVCRAMPAPEATAATAAMHWSVRSMFDPYRKIL